jgi:GTP-binding protein
MNARTKPSTPETRVVAAEFAAGATNVEGLPAPVVPEIAFAGRSNVGKSSLMNALMGRRNLVRTSNTPGCTRQLNVFSAQLADGLAVHLVDLPGYGYAKRSKTEFKGWGAMLEGYLLERPTLRAVFVLVDVRRGVEQEERDLLEFLASPPRAQRTMPVSVIVCATKVDKLSGSAQKPALAALRKESGLEVLGTSAETLLGREALWARIRHAVAG